MELVSLSRLPCCQGCVCSWTSPPRLPSPVLSCPSQASLPGRAHVLLKVHRQPAHPLSWQILGFVLCSGCTVKWGVGGSPGSLAHHSCVPSPCSFPDGSAGKESACNVGDLGSTPGLGRSPGKGNGYPLQYSCLENSMGCIVHGVTKSQTWLSNFHFSLLLWQIDLGITSSIWRWSLYLSQFLGMPAGPPTRKVSQGTA